MRERFTKLANDGSAWLKKTSNKLGIKEKTLIIIIVAILIFLLLTTTAVSAVTSNFTVKHSDGVGQSIQGMTETYLNEFLGGTLDEETLNSLTDQIIAEMNKRISNKSWSDVFTEENINKLRIEVNNITNNGDFNLTQAQIDEIANQVVNILLAEGISDTDDDATRDALIDSLVTKVSNMYEEINNLNETITKNYTEQNTLKKTVEGNYADLLDKYNTLLSSLNALDSATKKANEEQKSALEKTNSELKSQIEKTNKELTDQLNKSDQDTVAALKAADKTYRDAMASLVSQLKEANNSQEESMSSLVSSMISLNTSMVKIIQKSNNSASAIVDTLAKLYEYKAALNTQYANLLTDAAEADLDKAKSSVEDLQSKLDESKNKIDELENQNKEDVTTDGNGSTTPSGSSDTEEIWGEWTIETTDEDCYRVRTSNLGNVEREATGHEWDGGTSSDTTETRWVKVDDTTYDSDGNATADGTCYKWKKQTRTITTTVYTCNRNANHTKEDVNTGDWSDTGDEQISSSEPQ